MTDWSVACPDVCWFHICEHLSVSDISRLSSTCRLLRHRLWSKGTSLWTYLVYRRFRSFATSPIMRALSDIDPDEESIITENIRFCQRLASDREANAMMHEKFSSWCTSHEWDSRLSSARNDIRGFLACQRARYITLVPFLDGPVPLSSELCHLHYYR